MAFMFLRETIEAYKDGDFGRRFCSSLPIFCYLGVHEILWNKLLLVLKAAVVL
jgi:hypothetical protein